MIQHCPIAAKQVFIHAFNTAPSTSELSETENIEALAESVTISSLSDFKDANTISPEMIRCAAKDNNTYITLMNTIINGFPDSRYLTSPEIHSTMLIRELCA